MALSKEELQRFLDRTQPALLGVLGTLGEDGYPHLVPVWYRYDGKAVHVWTHEQRLWVRNARRDGRAAFSVQEIEPPYAAVVMRGRAEVRTGDDERISEVIRQITRRYIDEPQVESYIRAWAHLRTIVTIHPEKVSSWGRGY